MRICVVRVSFFLLETGINQNQLHSLIYIIFLFFFRPGLLEEDVI